MCVQEGESESSEPCLEGELDFIRVAPRVDPERVSDETVRKKMGTGRRTSSHAICLGRVDPRVEE